MSAFTSRLEPPLRKPEWLRIRLRTSEHFEKVRGIGRKTPNLYMAPVVKRQN